MKCCIAQIEGIWETPEKSLEKAERFIENAAGSGAALICFPEQFATGWDPLSQKNTEDIDGKTITGFQKLAREYSIAIIGSFREQFSPRPRNTTVAIGRDGSVLARYAKIHLFTPGQEDKEFTPGDALGLFTLDKVHLGLAICYDLRFPELFRIYRARDVHAVVIPAAWPQSRIRYWELFIQSRAAENQMYIIGVNTTGTNPVDRYAGASMIADPHGTIIARAGDAEELLYAEIDPNVAERVREDFPVENDSRSTLYQSLRQDSNR
ncbi:MAG: carbon-nitrogen hydrolase family protein [Methanoregula sp.]|nr:carbon-nitrogen hydrolase family protein [Methanoregula sp.]